MDQTVDPIAIIEEEAKDAAVALGVSGPLMNDFAKAIAARVALRFRGQQVYFAGLRRRREDRDQRIRGRFNGRNYDEIARDEGLSERQVRNIIGRPT